MDKRQDPQHIASEGLCNYSGDVHPLDHDGYWYNLKEWEANGYASCVDVCLLPDGPDGGRHIVISKLVINKPSKPEQLLKALESCGGGKELLGNVNAEIEACKGYGFYDPDCSDYREPSSIAFIIPDDSDEAADFTQYAKIHGAKVVEDESELWTLIWEWVAKHSCE